MCYYSGEKPNPGIWNQNQHTLKKLCVHTRKVLDQLFSKFLYPHMYFNHKGSILLPGSEVFGMQNGNSELSKRLCAVLEFCSQKSWWSSGVWVQQRCLDGLLSWGTPVQEQQLFTPFQHTHSMRKVLVTRRPSPLHSLAKTSSSTHSTMSSARQPPAGIRPRAGTLKWTQRMFIKEDKHIKKIKK